MTRLSKLIPLFAFHSCATSQCHLYSGRCIENCATSRLAMLESTTPLTSNTFSNVLKHRITLQIPTSSFAPRLSLSSALLPTSTPNQTVHIITSVRPHHIHMTHHRASFLRCVHYALMVIGPWEGYAWHSYLVSPPAHCEQRDAASYQFGSHC
jgi:hypothetical protein